MTLETAKQYLGTYNPTSALNSSFVARKLAETLIEEIALDQATPVQTRMDELEVLKAQIEHNLAVLGKTEKRRRKK